MATLDDSPSLFAGQTWSSWPTDVPLSPESDSGDENGKHNAGVNSDSMKLCKEDMGLFGQCPSQDEFYLVMCEKCDKVIKPKAFKRHLKQRHGESGIPTTVHLSQRLSCPKSKLSVSPNCKPTKASVKEMPIPIGNAQKSGTGINNKLSGVDKGRRNHHTVPFVKMERVELNKYMNPSHQVENAVSVSKPSPLMNGTHGSNNSIAGSSSSSSRSSSKSSNRTPTPPTPTTPVSQSLTIPSFSTSSSTVSVASSSLTTTTPTTCLYTTMTTTTAPTMTPLVTPSTAPNLAAAILGVGTGNNTTVVKSRSSGGNISSGNNLNSSSSSSLSGSSTTTPTTTPHTTPVISSSKKKAARLDKPDKLIPCKDREFDCNKHCGVIVEETGKPCTRSLTCKTHALSLRRKVPGRRKPFDDLLKEHRAVKEAFMKQKAEQKAAQLALTKPSMSPGASPLVPLLASTSKNNQSHNSIPSANNQSSRAVLHGSAHKPTPRPFVQKPNIFRPAGSSLHSPPHQSVPKDDTGSGPPLLQSPDGHLSDMEGEDDEDDKNDRSYLTYHPRPAATCTFGARHHTFNGRGCYMFNRRVDILRAAFLNVLEKHLNPPPPKKLCVESNLPKEPQFLSDSKDPYEFNLVDTTSTGATQHFNTVLNSSSNKNTVKPKSKISSGRSKSKDGSSGGSRSPAHSSTSAPAVTGAVKRKRSGSGNAATSPTSYSTVSSGYGTTTTIISSIASLNTHNTNSPLTAIAIPSVNLSNTTLSHFNANLSGGQAKNPKNNLLKDIGLVVRGTDLSSIVNGQYVIGGAQLLDEKILQQTHVMAGNKANPKLVNSIEAVQKGNLIPTNAIFVDSAMQPGTTLLAPVTVGSVPSNTVISLANTSVAQQPQASPSTTPSPLFRSGSVSPQVSSPLPNGIVQSPSDKNTSNQRHALLHHKGPHKTLHTQPGVSQPGLLSASQVINVSSNNPNHVFTQLAQLQVKPGMAKSGANKVTVQPVSLTFPITNLGAVSGQTPTHTLFITSSEESQRHDLQQVSSSPSSLIS